MAWRCLLGVTIVALTYGEDHDITVVSVNARRGGGADEAEELAAEAGTEAPPTEDAADAADAGGDDE